MSGNIQSPISLRGDSDADNFGLCVSARGKAAIECKDRNLFLILQINMAENHNDYAIICKNYECKSYYHLKSCFFLMSIQQFKITNFILMKERFLSMIYPIFTLINSIKKGNMLFFVRLFKEKNYLCICI